MTEKADRKSNKLTRRRWLAGAATAASIALLRTATGQKIHAAVGAVQPPQVPLPMLRMLGRNLLCRALLRR